jgi:long-chain acyl-CoA synthetase
LIREHAVTLMAGPPTMWAAFLGLTELQSGDLASLRVALSGAAKLDPDLADRLRRRFGVEVCEGYGLTETCGTLASSLDAGAPPGSVGPPLPGVEARLVGTDGLPVLVGDPGELWVRGPMVSPGYWRAGQVVSALTPDGWFATGDLAVVDDDGFLAIVDRIKDVIIVSGFNVHPTEVEHVLGGHPMVAEAAVIGESDDETGERVVAFVVPSGPVRPDPLDLRDFAAARLARYKVPRRITVVADLPHGVTGKLRRNAIADRR